MPDRTKHPLTAYRKKIGRDLLAGISAFAVEAMRSRPIMSSGMSASQQHLGQSPNQRIWHT